MIILLSCAYHSVVVYNSNPDLEIRPPATVGSYKPSFRESETKQFTQKFIVFLIQRPSSGATFINSNFNVLKKTLYQIDIFVQLILR